VGESIALHGDEPVDFEGDKLGKRISLSTEVASRVYARPRKPHCKPPKLSLREKRSPLLQRIRLVFPTLESGPPGGWPV
jgi:hypothetical protein